MNDEVLCLNGESANSWDYYRQSTDRFELFFSQHYYWAPETRHFRDSADRQRQEKEPRSITRLEVCHDIFDNPQFMTES
jgi:hypothetical protein